MGRGHREGVGWVPGAEVVLALGWDGSLGQRWCWPWAGMGEPLGWDGRALGLGWVSPWAGMGEPLGWDGRPLGLGWASPWAGMGDPLGWDRRALGLGWAGQLAHGDKFAFTRVVAQCGVCPEQGGHWSKEDPGPE